MSVSIDGTYQGVISSLAPELRVRALDLLAGGGLATGGSARWDAIFKLEPCRDLPVFAATPDLPVEALHLDAFRAAHHCACFYGVLADRLADRQVAPSPQLEDLLAHFLAHWRRSLARASGDPVLADRAIARGLRLWGAGVRLEQAALARRSLGLVRYARIVLLKLGWAGIASEHLLRRMREPRRAGLFRDAYLLLMLSLQCVDDAMDGAEDEALHGASIPTALGFPPPALFAAGARLARAAALDARAGGFERFARWISGRADELDRLTAARISVHCKVAGLAIASTLEEACRSIAQRTRGGSGAMTSSARSASPHRLTIFCSGATPSSLQ
jgi:hypothetical protein